MNYLGSPKGRILDMRIGNVEVDIKDTISNNMWAIPKEAVGHPCLIVRENEAILRCSVGLIIAKDAYLCPRANRDLKRIFSAAGLRNAIWLLRNHPYPGR
jgi:Restriction endonuclease NaeI